MSNLIGRSWKNVKFHVRTNTSLKGVPSSFFVLLPFWRNYVSAFSFVYTKSHRLFGWSRLLCTQIAAGRVIGRKNIFASVERDLSFPPVPASVSCSRFIDSGAFQRCHFGVSAIFKSNIRYISIGDICTAVSHSPIRSKSSVCRVAANTLLRRPHTSNNKRWLFVRWSNDTICKCWWNFCRRPKWAFCTESQTKRNLRRLDTSEIDEFDDDVDELHLISFGRGRKR